MRSSKVGFTLIELMAAVLVFSIMLLIMGRVFSDSTRAMGVGMRSAEANSSGRAVMEFVAREISMALVDDEVAMFNDGFSSSGGGFYFVAALGEVTSNERKAKQIRYLLDKGQLKRWMEANAEDMDAFDGASLDWRESHNKAAKSSERAILLNNVHKFDIKIFTAGGKLTSTYDSTLDPAPDGLPVYADIFLSLMGEEATIEYNSLPTGDPQVRFAEKNLQYFTRRVYFKNMDGYNRVQ